MLREIPEKSHNNTVHVDTHTQTHTHRVFIHRLLILTSFSGRDYWPFLHHLLHPLSSFLFDPQILPLWVLFHPGHILVLCGSASLAELCMTMSGRNPILTEASGTPRPALHLLRSTSCQDRRFAQLVLKKKELKKEPVVASVEHHEAMHRKSYR